LEQLYKIVDIHWTEICEVLPKIEALSEEPSFAGAHLASIIAAKCFYHLQEYKDALKLAMCAGKYLNISEKSEFVEALLVQCIDEYTSLRLAKYTDETVEIDPRMENIIAQLFQRCYEDSCYEQAVGIALDAHRIDTVQETCERAMAAGKTNILEYTFKLCLGARNIVSRSFRSKVVDMLITLYGTLAVPDYANMCFGLQFLNKPAEVAKILNSLLRSASLEGSLQAYQIAFDLQETENQGFVLQVIANYPGLDEDVPAVVSASTTTDEDTTTTTTATTSTTAVGEEASSADVLGTSSAEYTNRMDKLRRILIGGLYIDLTLNFLCKQVCAICVYHMCTNVCTYCMY
jgi:26S proteasome regulatory subunit N2